MTGGLMQLVAYGAQDIYLSGNPQITFFKIVYRRYTNFAIETIEHQFIGEPKFGNTFAVKITRNADLISKMYLRVVIDKVNPGNNKFAWVKRLGHAILSHVDIEIGGSRIDTQYGTWLDIWYELARQGDHERGYAKMIGDVPELTNYDSCVKPQYVLYIPLQFWFNRIIGLSIPLIALQYSEVVMHVGFEPVEKVIVRDCNFDPNMVSMKDATILVNYVYLDTEERRRFAIVGHEYLVEQLQFNGTEPVVSGVAKYMLNFNFPTKEIIWATRNGNYTTGKRFLYYTNKKKWSMKEASNTIIQKSISIGFNPEPIVGGTWFEVNPGEITTVGTFNINNRNENPVYVNPTSVRFGNYGITDKISADIDIDENGLIIPFNIITLLTVRDLSVPLEYATDTRYNTCDPIVNIFSNYGILIDGTGNPIESGLIQFNGYDRFDRREGAYFNYAQPFNHHTNTPKDGINVYSFALHPEEHQPSGTANLSRIETTTLSVTFTDFTYVTGIEDIHYFNPENVLYIYATSYNILRILSGICGLAYSY